MSRTIKRGPPPKRLGARRRQPVRKATLFERAVSAVPVSEDTIRKAATWTITGGGIALALAAVTWIGIPGMIGTAIAEGAGQAGFRVEQIEVTGLKRMENPFSIRGAGGDKQQTEWLSDNCRINQH